MTLETIWREIAALQRRVADLETLDVVPIVAFYTTNAGQSIPDATDTIVDFEDVGADPWGLVTTGAAWKFTAPVAGYYLVASMIEFDLTTTWAPGERISLRLHKNGIVAKLLAAKEDESATNHRVSLSGTSAVTLAAGDYVDIRINQSSGGSLALITTSQNNHVAIARLTP